MKTQNRGISTPVGILIILIAILGIGGILVWQLPQLPKEEVVPLEDETVDLSSKALATEDWETYRNEEYGYEIKYPLDWRVTTEELDVETITFVTWEEGKYTEFYEGIRPDEAVTVIMVRRDTTLNKFYELFKSSECYPNLISQSEVTLSGYPGKKIICVDESFGTTYNMHYWIQKDNTTYILWIKTSGLSQSPVREKFFHTFNQMLSTFKFIEKPTSFITVLSPNGGEEWTVNHTYEIKWESKAIEMVKIFLVDYSSPGCGLECIFTIADDVPANLGRYFWTISPKNLIAGNAYEISIQELGFWPPRTGDESDNYFSIVEKP